MRKRKRERDEGEKGGGGPGGQRPVPFINYHLNDSCPV